MKIAKERRKGLLKKISTPSPILPMPTEVKQVQEMHPVQQLESLESAFKAIKLPHYPTPSAKGKTGARVQESKKKVHF